MERHAAPHKTPEQILAHLRPVRVGGSAGVFAFLHRGRRHLSLRRRLQQPANTLLLLRQRVHKVRRRHLQLGHRPWQRFLEQLFLLSGGQPLLLAQPALPGGVAALSDGPHAGAQVRGGGRRRVSLDPPLGQGPQHGRAGGLPLRLLGFHRLQRVLQPLCGCGGPVPLSALDAGRGGDEQTPGPLRGAGGAEPAQQLLLLRRAGGLSHPVFRLHDRQRGLPLERQDLRRAGGGEPFRLRHGLRAGLAGPLEPCREPPHGGPLQRLRLHLLLQGPAVRGHPLQPLLPAGLPLHAGDF